MRRTLSVLSTVTVGLWACGGDFSDPQTGTVASPATVNHYVSNGQGVSAWGGDEFSSFGLNAYSYGQPGADRAVWVDFYRNSVDPASWVCEISSGPCKCRRDEPCPPDYTCEWEYCRYTRYSWEYGWGEIDSSALRASRRRASLNASITGDNGFWIEHCDVDELNGIFNCSGGEEGGGEVALELRSNGREGSSWSGTTQARYGGYAYRSNGNESSVMAGVAGSAFGMAATNGLIRSGMSVSVERYPAE